MNKFAKRALALLLLAGVAQTLSACAVYETRPREVVVYHDNYWHRW